MECSQSVQRSKELWVTVEKQIIRDLAEGILLELVELADESASPSGRKSLRQIAKYARNLARLAE